VSQLYVVTQRVIATQQLDLALAKGCVVAVIKQRDPMGNCDRWFIDNGGLVSQMNFCSFQEVNAFGALTLLVGPHQEGHPVYEKLSSQMICILSS